MRSLLAFLAVFFLFFLNSPVWAGNNAGAAFATWPDTGQDKCYDTTGEIECPSAGESFYGQDAQHHGPPRSYTKLDGTGNDLSDAAEAWTMVRDNVTGLTWEVKTDDGGIHDRDNTYSWCDTNGTSNGGYAGTCGAGTDTEDFIASLNVANYGGYSDWRLPTVQELVSLVDASIPYPGPTINTDFSLGHRVLIIGRILPVPAIMTMRGACASTMAMCTTSVSTTATTMPVPCGVDSN